MKHVADRLDSRNAAAGVGGADMGERCEEAEAVARKADDVIVFTHVPKTAGMAVRGMLEMALPLRSVHYVGRRVLKSEGRPYPGKGVDQDHDKASALLVAANHHPRLRAVVGHFGHGFAELVGIDNPAYVTMLRDPIERVLSMWRFTGRKPTRRFFNDHDDATNGMTQRFGRGDVAAAMTALETYEIVGLQAQFEEFALRLGRLIGAPRLLYCYTNTTRPRNPPIELEREVYARNWQDVELYEWAIRKFGRSASKEAHRLAARNAMLAPAIKVYQRARRSMCKLHPACL